MHRYLQKKSGFLSQVHTAYDIDLLASNSESDTHAFSSDWVRRTFQALKGTWTECSPDTREPGFPPALILNSVYTSKTLTLHSPMG